MSNNSSYIIFILNMSSAFPTTSKGKVIKTQASQIKTINTVSNITKKGSNQISSVSKYNQKNTEQVVDKKSYTQTNFNKDKLVTGNLKASVNNVKVFSNSINSIKSLGLIGQISQINKNTSKTKKLTDSFKQSNFSEKKTKSEDTSSPCKSTLKTQSFLKNQEKTQPVQKSLLNLFADENKNIKHNLNSKDVKIPDLKQKKTYSNTFIDKTYKPLSKEDKNKFIDDMNKESELRFNLYGDIFINIKNEIQNLEKNKNPPYIENSNKIKKTNQKKKSLDQIVETKEVDENDIAVSNKNSNVIRKKSNLQILKKSVDLTSLTSFSNGVQNIINSLTKDIKESPINDLKTNSPLISPVILQNKDNLTKVQLKIKEITQPTPKIPEDERRKLIQLQLERIIQEKAEKLIDGLKPFDKYYTPFPNFYGYKKSEEDEEFSENNSSAVVNIPVFQSKSNKIDEMNFKNNRRLYSLSMANNLVLNNIKLSTDNDLEYSDHKKLATENDTPLVCQINRPDLSNFKKNQYKDKKK